MESKLIEDNEAGEITNLELNYPITVDDSAGLWKEL